MWWFVTLSGLLSALMVLQVWCQDDCPSGCEGCFCQLDEEDFITVSCEEYHNDSPAPCINESVVRLLIYSSDIHTLRKDDFLNALALVMLHIANSPRLTAIEEGTFDNLLLLETVYLTNCGFTELPDNIFSNLINLEQLNLQHNSLKKVSNLVFNGLTDLKTLTLKGNNISEIEDSAFSGAGGLETLDLSYNFLSHVPENMLQGLPALKSLRLNDNGILSIAEHAFQDCNLVSLDLDYNQITSLPETLFESQSQLAELYLSSNSISEFPTSAMTSLRGLTELRMSDNLIILIPANAFDSMELLESLHLDNLPYLDTIEDGAFNGLPNLRYLRIENCHKLDSFTPSMLQPDEKPELQLLVLNNNSLTELSESLFQDLPNLRAAPIYGNPLECSCAVTWMREAMDDETKDWAIPWRSGKEALECETPSHFKGRKIYDIDSYDLTCEQPILEERSENINSEKAIFQAQLKRGFPSTMWTTPDGTVILPQPIPSMLQDPLYMATEQRLSNNSILATLTVNIINEKTEGTYKLEATNAGGQIEQAFDLVRPAPQSGMSSGQVVGIIIGVFLIIAVLGGVGYMYLHRQQTQVPYREMDRPTDSPFSGPTTSPSVTSDDESKVSLTAGTKSYGSTQQGYGNVSGGDPQIV